tara:strand:+ start:5245 stop:5460 length:216 start_codon:yes stop_codon:yes gene_type:complete
MAKSFKRGNNTKKENNKSGKPTKPVIVASNWHRYFRKWLPDHSEEEINLLATKDFLGGLRFKWWKYEEVEI